MHSYGSFRKNPNAGFKKKLHHHILHCEIHLFSVGFFSHCSLALNILGKNKSNPLEIFISRSGILIYYCFLFRFSPNQKSSAQTLVQSGSSAKESHPIRFHNNAANESESRNTKQWCNNLLIIIWIHYKEKKRPLG